MSGSPKASGFDELQSCSIILVSSLRHADQGGVVAGRMHQIMERVLPAVAASKGLINGKTAHVGIALQILLEHGYLRIHTDCNGHKIFDQYEVCDPCLKTLQVSTPSTPPQMAIAEDS